MKITCTFAWNGDSREMPYLAAAYDEYTFDSHGEIPNFYKVDRDKADGELRECVLTVPDGAIERLFLPAQVTVFEIEPVGDDNGEPS